MMMTIISISKLNYLNCIFVSSNMTYGIGLVMALVLGLAMIVCSYTLVLL